jgi:hypothetical protein
MSYRRLNVYFDSPLARLLDCLNQPILAVMRSMFNPDGKSIQQRHLRLNWMENWLAPTSLLVGEVLEPLDHSQFTLTSGIKALLNV